MTHSLANLMKSFFSHYLPVQLEWLNSLGKRPELCGVNRDAMNKTARVAGVNFTLHNRTAFPGSLRKRPTWKWGVRKMQGAIFRPSIHGHKKALIKRAFYRPVIRPELTYLGAY